MSSSDWKTLPTGYFTHQLVSLPNPLEEAPESPDRIEAIETRLMLGGFGGRVRRIDCGPAPMDAVLLAHDADYVSALELASKGDREALARFSEPDTRVGADTFDCAMASAGAAVRAVDAVFSRTVKNAFCGVRPPGHHASRNRASGFCYLNNAAIAALYARKRYRLSRVMILDFDAHHGDGTEEIVAGIPEIRFLSLFQWPLFPHRRMEPTPGNVVISPLEAGADGVELRRIVEDVWMPEIEQFEPELIILSAGFDAHAEERIAQLKAAEIDYARVTRLLVEASWHICEGRLVSVLEGGYMLRSLARSVFTHLQGLVRTPEP
ncbi:histone deacetylase family protein [Sutterella sp.]|uniref:histone deacetylase family protein n=1 Tax=Sutterella sp. TaxID=1981025 RepID=UPI0026E0E534|nr:histone deacetylase family protein [Sutterella sp.]MDO5532023.1 histone deacetylase family protein [Sutterella sp.]